MKGPVSSVFFAVLAVGMHPAFSQDYPSKPIRLIVPFAPGGGVDFNARVVGPKLAEALGQSVVVDSRPGAGGTIGTEIGVKSPSDGYTYTLLGGTYAVTPSLFKLGFDPINDITPVILLSYGPHLIVVHPSLPVKTTRDLIALARAKPNTLTFGSSGPGGTSHLGMELFSYKAGVKMVHVPYKGGGQVVPDVMAGHLQLFLATLPSSLQQIRARRLKAIAVTTAQRSDLAPDIPTVSETSDIKDLDVMTWYGLIAPKNLPKPILDRVSGEINKILKTKEISDRFASEGVVPGGGTPAQFHALIQKEIETWRKVVQITGTKFE